MAAYSFVQYPISVTTTGPFNVTFPYLQKYQVEVRKNGTLLVTGTDYSWPTDSTISLVANAVNGDVIEIRRNSLKKADGSTGILVTFVNSAKLPEKDLNDEAKQAFYLAQEAFDAAANAIQLDATGNYDSLVKRIKNLGTPILGTDATTKNYVDLTLLGATPATPLAISGGGTGAGTAVGARSSLGSGATGDSLFTTGNPAAARALIDVPSNAEALVAATRRLAYQTF